MPLRLIPLPRPRREAGLCWTVPAPAGIGEGDDGLAPERSGLRLFEDGQEIGPGHARHDDIRTQGAGRFSHWGEQIYLSCATPGSRADRHRYTALVDPAAHSGRLAVLAAAAAVDPAGLDSEQRYAWGERLFETFVPDVKLPEWGRSFFHDAELIADYERFDTANYRSLDRKLVLREMLKLALRQPGELAECGVFRGASAYLAAKAIAEAPGERRLHLFDSFAGLSAPGATDGGFWRAGALACGQAEVAANLGPYAGRAVFHPGWIPERFAEAADQRFCFLHLDVDLYQPTHDALEFFHPRMVPGAVILCDDYGFDTCPGARRAMDEFFAGRPEPVLHLPTGQGVVVLCPASLEQKHES